VSATVAIALGLVVAVVLRHMLTVGLIGPGIATPWIYGYIASNAAHGMEGAFRFGVATHLGEVFFAFRWLWLVPFAYLISVPSLRMKWLTVLMLIGLAIAALVIFWGGDHTRSTAYLFPAFVCLVCEWPKAWPKGEKALSVILVASVLTPQLNWVSGKSGSTRPFPIAAFRMATGKDPADLLRPPPRLLDRGSSPQAPK
jgi:hypothetical protein